MLLDQHAVVAVIGSGTMGAGIAQTAAVAGHPVKLYDINPQASARAIAGIEQTLGRLVEKGRLTDAQCRSTLTRITPVAQLAGLADAALVIEAAVERLEVKQQLFCELAAICSPQTLLTSNTSSISITALAGGVAEPQRVAGLHFFNPAPVMKLVEVVRGLATSAETVAALCQLVSRWGKTAVCCHSTPGFIVNRVARPFYGEAWRALEEQVAPAAVIDAALRDSGGFPMGPLELTDLIGQDVNFAVTCSVFNAFWQERRFLPSLIQQELVSGGRWGKKSGQGVYRWPRDTQPLPFYPTLNAQSAARRVSCCGPRLPQFAGHLALASDNVTKYAAIELDEVLVMESCGESAQQVAQRLNRPVVLVDLAFDAGRAPLAVVAAAQRNLPHQTEKAIHFLQQQDKQVLVIDDYPGMLVWRTVAMLVNEALDACQKGVASEADIDTAMRLGVNYPRGPLAWGVALGWSNILTLLENLRRHYGEERYRPCSLLRRRALMESCYES
ncbi:3-hydroxyacyl-CoA dehydrogenase PaaH [Entomohabitans teleogrylli]|uniref:3-hydroxyacyl-CoA dehydrogenase PaaH n=1 Tax=Entomohabitans teleogrylli TaxID=1384589 RepID=UPI00073D81DB|nr:3-hydroxyacyl-CoA dehydrogenase PaaH [Entomohabitans teleogrylli]